MEVIPIAFPVQLFKMTKEVNSTARPSGSGTIYQCVTNDQIDVISPRLALQIGTAATPAQYNYAYVPAWNRYYWIDRWALEGPLWAAYCSVDPLASWRPEIGNTRAYVLRAAAEYDSNLIDTLYPTEGDPTINLTPITVWWTEDDLDYSKGYFVVGLINEEGATDYVYMTPKQFKTFAATAFSDAWYSDNVKDQPWMTKSIFDPMQYLSSVTWFPLYPTGSGGDPTVAKLGYWSTGVSCYKAATYGQNTIVNIPIPRHPQAAARGPWVNNAPYTTYTLETWPFGRIALDPALLYNAKYLYLRMIVDYISGKAILNVYTDGLTGTLVATQSAQLGINVQISQVLKDTFSGVMGVGSGIVSTVASAVTGNVAGVIGGIAGAISSGVNAAYPDVTTQGQNAGFASLYGTWRLVGKFYTLAHEDLQHRGRPLYAVRQLSTLPGYQLLTDTDLKIPCTKAEMDQIRGYLETGYFYE